jgi:Bardet-Biedl syndrome 7 protein
MQEENSHEWLSNEYKYILEHEDEIKENFKTRPRALEYLSGIVTDLYVDWYKFTGQNVSDNMLRTRMSS